MAGFEQRRFKRVKAKFMLSYKLDRVLQAKLMAGGDKIYAVMGDISSGGLMIITQYDIPIGSKLLLFCTVIDEMALHDYEKSKTLEINGIVKSNRQIKHNEFNIGIEFFEVSEEDRKFLEKFAK